jgi:hypothetical protein
VRQERTQRTDEFFYSGPLNPCAETRPQKSLSAESARTVALSAWNLPGRLRLTSHYTKRSKARKFGILDFEEVLRTGRPTDKGIYCPKYKNVKYVFRGSVDGLGFRIVFALDATQDYAAAPLVILITAAWSTRNGVRK